MCSGTGGAMDAAVLDMKHCADLFLFSTTFPVNHLLPPDHKETQPFHPAVQRSADSSSNPRGPTQPHPNPTSQAATLTYRSNPTFRAATLTYRPNPISRAATLTYRPEKPAREACAACRRTLQEGSLEASPRRSPGDRQHTPHGRTSHAPHLPTKKEQRRTSNPPLFSKHHPISISPSAQQSSLSIPAHSSADPPPS